MQWNHLNVTTVNIISCFLSSDFNGPINIIDLLIKIWWKKYKKFKVITITITEKLSLSVYHKWDLWNLTVIILDGFHCILTKFDKKDTWQIKSNVFEFYLLIEVQCIHDHNRLDILGMTECIFHNYIFLFDLVWFDLIKTIHFGQSNLC